MLTLCQHAQHTSHNIIINAILPKLHHVPEIKASLLNNVTAAKDTYRPYGQQQY